MVVDSATNLNNSAVIIPDGMLAKESSSSLFKIGDGTKTWSQLPYVNVPATVAPKAPGTAAVGTSAKYAREDHVHPVQTTVAKLATARTISLTGPVTGSAKFDGSGNVAIATTIPPSPRTPLWLTANKSFYVATNGSDTLDSGRGESSSKPFKTIQACVNYICDNYNLSSYNAIIFIAAGVYNEALTLGSYSSTTGIIIFRNSSNSNVEIRSTLTQTNSVITLTAEAGKYQFEQIIITSAISDDYLKWSNSNQIIQRTLWIKNTAHIILMGCTIQLTFTGSLTAATTNTHFRNIEIIDGGLLETYGTSSVLTNTFILPNKQISNSSTNCFRLNNNETLKLSNTNSRNLQISVTGNCTLAEFITVGNKSSVIFSGTGNVKCIYTNTIYGKRFSITGGSFINVNGAGLKYFPGSIDGTIDATSYSWYA